MSHRASLAAFARVWPTGASWPRPSSRSSSWPPPRSSWARGCWLARGDTGAGLRLTFWQDSLAAFADAPLTGTGPGTWAFAHWAYRDDLRPLDVVAHAHDAPIQLAAEMGLVGLVAGAVFVVGVVLLLRRGVAGDAAAGGHRRRHGPGRARGAVPRGQLLGPAALRRWRRLPAGLGGGRPGAPGPAFRPRHARRSGRDAAGGRSSSARWSCCPGIAPRGAPRRRGVAGPWRLDGRRRRLSATPSTSTPTTRSTGAPSASPPTGRAIGALAAEQLAIGARQADDPFMAANAALALARLWRARRDEAAALLTEATAKGDGQRRPGAQRGRHRRAARPAGGGRPALRDGDRAPAVDRRLRLLARSGPAALPAGQAEAALARMGELVNADVIPTSPRSPSGPASATGSGRPPPPSQLPPAVGRDANLAWLAAMQGDRDRSRGAAGDERGSNGAVVVVALASAADRFDDPDGGSLSRMDRRSSERLGPGRPDQVLGAGRRRGGRATSTSGRPSPRRSTCATAAS